MSEPILVVGSTGVLGLEICRRLSAEGRAVRALVREGSQGRGELEAMGCELAVGDLLDPESLRRACEGAAQVVNTATSIATLKKGTKMAAIDRDGIFSLVDAAERAGVGHFVFVSVPRDAERIRFFGWKREVEERLRASALNATVLQPAGFMESAFVPTSGWDPGRGSVKMIGRGDTPSRWISLVDVAKAAVAVCGHPELQGRDWPMGGPEKLSPREVLEVFEQVVGSNSKVQSVPRGLVRGISHLLMPFRPDLASVMQIVTTDMERFDVETPPELMEHIEPMISVREFAETQRDSVA